MTAENDGHELLPLYYKRFEVRIEITHNFSNTLVKRTVLELLQTVFTGSAPALLFVAAVLCKPSFWSCIGLLKDRCSKHLCGDSIDTQYSTIQINLIKKVVNYCPKLVSFFLQTG